jgi:hypothetical protein
VFASLLCGVEEIAGCSRWAWQEEEEDDDDDRDGEGGALIQAERGEMRGL